MADHTLDIAAFRLLFPAFSNPAVTPNAVIELQWTMAGVYLGTYDGCILAGDRLQAALNLMTAHLLELARIIAGAGDTPATIGPVTSSTIDKITVTLAPPPVTDGWRYWLASTPYGQQLWALLTVATAGGFYVGGRPETAAFRKVGGRF